MMNDMDTGLLLLRAVIGLTLLAHGAQKFSGLDAAATALESLGFVPGRRTAILAGLAEAGGGLALALGLLTPAAASVVFGVMLVAGVSAHLKGGFFLQKGGYEYTLVLGLAGLSVAFTGPGRLSIDALLGLDRGGLQWGLLALVVGLVGGGLQLATRRRPAAAPDKA
jgi:putative oxidoreductase